VINHYQNEETVQDYDKKRFLTLGGKLVDTQEKEIVSKFCTNIAEGYILDIGTGTGRFSTIFQENKIIGIDSSILMLKKAKTRMMVVCCDMKYLPFKRDSFSTAFSIRTFIRIKELANYFKEINRVLKQEGVFVFDTSNKYSIGRLANYFSQDPLHEFFSKNKVTREIELGGFTIENKECAFVLPRGFYQAIDGQLARVLWKCDVLFRALLHSIVNTIFWKTRKYDSV
jgi:ubiquinone/menaquinone biosynthesis C-methylase UbiE